MTVEENRKLVGDSIIGRAAPAVVDQAGDVPFIVRAVAEDDRCAQSVIIPEAGLGDVALIHRFLEARVLRDARVEPGLQPFEVALAGKPEILREVGWAGDSPRGENTARTSAFARAIAGICKAALRNGAPLDYAR